MTTTEKACKKCREVKNLDEYHRHTGSPDGRQYWCKACRNERKWAYNITNPQKRRSHEYEMAVQRRYRSSKANLVKVAARARLARAVKAGKIIKPSVCSKCPSTKQIQGHHEDYTKPLEVEWLCRKCHAAHHRRFKGTEAMDF